MGIQTPAAVVIGRNDSPPDLAEFQTPETAHAIRIGELGILAPQLMGFLGVQSDTNHAGQVVVTAVAADSPAFAAGVQSNDILLEFNHQPVSSPENLRHLIESASPRQSVSLSVLRDGATTELLARLTPLGGVGRPLEQIRLGVRFGEPFPRGGLPIEEILPDSTGARAGLKPGDVLLKINDTRLDDSAALLRILAAAPANEIVTITLDRGDSPSTVQARLAPVTAPDRPSGFFGGGRGFFNRSNRGVLRLAIIGIEFPDVKHNARIATSDWEREFFSTNSYTGANATGQPAHGSINDFYTEQSAGALRVTGKMFDWIQLSKKRLDYQPAASSATNGGDDGVLLGSHWTDEDAPLVDEALNALTTRDGRDALANFEGVIFLYAGSMAARNDTSVYWPHTTSTQFQYRRMRYVVSFEGGSRMADISILCHEIGHVLGLPDLYVRRSPGGLSTATNSASGSFPRRNPNPYAESLANWDLMSVQVGSGRPQHLSAWSKEQLGWIKPTVLNPLVRQKLILAPIENSTNQCFKIPLRPDGSEYLLLENRRRIGFDQSVPAEGLLVWRVVYGRPVLEEAHGLTGANAARLDIRRIPFPTDRNDSFTPFSKPSSAAFTGDELPVYLTDIRRLPDGRITFSLGCGYD